MTDRFRLDGRKILVTGGAGEIGNAIVTGAHERGAAVGVYDLAIPPGAERVPGIAWAQGSVTDADALATSVGDLVGELGGLNGLILAAGRMTFTPMADLDFDTWRQDIAVNLDGAFLTLQHCLPHLPDGATIVFVSSVTAHNGSRLSPSYAASKAALHGLARSLVHELLPCGIRVNCVSPGPVDTRFARAYFGKLDHAPGSIASVEQIADATLFLTSDASSHVNGESLILTGGYAFA